MGVFSSSIDRSDNPFVANGRRFKSQVKPSMLRRLSSFPLIKLKKMAQSGLLGCREAFPSFGFAEPGDIFEANVIKNWQVPLQTGDLLY